MRLQVDTVAPYSDGTSRRRSAPAASSARCVRPTRSSSTPRRARTIARAMPWRVKLPCASTPSWRSPSRYAPPWRSGSISSRNSRSPRFSRSAADAPARRRQRDVADRVERRLRDALDQLQRDVAGEAVGDDDVGDALGEPAALDVADETQRVAAVALRREPRVRVEHELAAALRLDAVREQADARALDAEHGAGVGGPHERELHEDLRVARRRSRRRRAASPGARGSAASARARAGARPARGGCAAARRPARRRSSRCRRAPARARRRPRARPGTIEASGVPRTARTGSGSLAIEIGASTISTPPPGSAQLAGRPEQHTPTPCCGGDPRARGNLSRSEIGAVGVDRDDRHRRQWSCIVVVLARSDDLATGVGAAHRAHAMRSPRAVAARARIERRARPSCAASAASRCGCAIAFAWGPASARKRSSLSASLRIGALAGRPGSPRPHAGAGAAAGARRGRRVAGSGRGAANRGRGGACSAGAPR